MAAVPARRKVAAPLPARRPGARAQARRTKRAHRAPAHRRAGARQAAVRARWIGLVFVLLAGIVFFNVDLLQMNREIARNADRAAAVKTENARLRTDLARLGSSERIQQVAAQAGLVLPAPGEVRYLRAAPATDAKRAAKRIDRGEGVGARRSRRPCRPAQAPEPQTQARPAAGRRPAQAGSSRSRQARLQPTATGP